MPELSIPKNFQLIYSNQKISTEIDHIAREISDWASQVLTETTKPVLAVCILRGGVFFFSDLLQAIPYSIEPSFCRCMSYSQTDNSADQTLRLVTEPENLAGRHVLFVDDICDSGRTLDKLTQYAKQNGAIETKTAVLIHRASAQSAIIPDFTAISHHGEEWFVGYGMDDKNSYSNLPQIYTIATS